MDNNIEKFLYGHNETERLVYLKGSKSSNIVECIYQNKDNSKIVVQEKFKPFVYVKDLNNYGIKLYSGSTSEYKKRVIRERGISTKLLKTNGYTRLENGYKYIFYGNSVNDIMDFLKYGGAKDVGYNDPQKLTYALKPEEMFLIQTGKRLFKGIEKYDDLHKLTYDIETTGLDPKNKRIFMIGLKDNKGDDHIIGVNKPDDDEEEKTLILKFFKLYTKIKPTIINHYNGENFDWNFILERCLILGIDVDQRRGNLLITPTTLVNDVAISRTKASVKYGNETVKYIRTNIWGINNIDIMHAAKRTQAINTDIKNVQLKYVCKFEGIAKTNRMYVKGDQIYKIWHENKNYVINKLNNIYKIIPEKYQNYSNKYLIKLIDSENKHEDITTYFKLESIESSNNLEIITGSEIVRQYLVDDLYETNEVDKKYNESSFLLAQMIPATFERICTMGNAAVWTLVMAAWSYENDLAIPIPDVKEDFSGGLARAYYIGLAKDLGKVDFAGLYPTLQLTYNAFPESDITNVLKRILLYLLTTRNTYKTLASDDSIDKHLRSFYKTKQLPLKILNNSLFGALGSGVAFPWGETMLAARITCLGRLHLRKLIRFFVGFGYTPILAVTDGVNFEIPKMVTRDLNLKKYPNGIDINELKFSVGDKNYVGHNAIIEYYNHKILKFNIGENRYIMVDNDGLFKASLTLSRINYALKNMKDKIKLTGNTIKSKGMPEFIEEFFDKGMEMVLGDKPEEFIEYYYSYLEDIYYEQIPLKKIASKSRIKQSIASYNQRGKNKNGGNLPKQAHMELCIQNSVEFELGTVIYHVNVGTAKSHGDTKILTDRKTGEEKYSSYMISSKELEDNPNMLGKYNIKKYVTAFNKRISGMLIGFNENVRSTLLKEDPAKREFFTTKDLEFIKTQNDSIKESMFLEKLEIKHWNDTGYDPTTIYDKFSLPEGETLKGVSDYKNKLGGLNDKYKPKIKAIYDKHEPNDIVLKKYGTKYTIHTVSDNDYLLDVTNKFDEFLTLK